MKGLLLKDLYMSEKYCRAFLLIVVIFFGMSLMSGPSFFSAGLSLYSGGTDPGIAGFLR